MRTKPLFLFLLLPSLIIGLYSVGTALRPGVAVAHECWDESDPPPDFPQSEPEGQGAQGKGKANGKQTGGSGELPEGYWRDGDQVCRDTTVMPNWRDSYIPLFDLEDRDDEQQRKDAQRWREECNTRENEYQQACQWSYGGFSGVENDDGSLHPNEWHAGFAMSHCGAFEFFHQCDGEGHDVEQGEGVHDAHGGAIYADVCLTANPESKYCDDGPTDTQAGIVIMDHNPCGAFVPVVACTDEYHVVRPLDQAYTQRQMENSVAATQLIVADPARYVCGTHASGAGCRERLQPVNDVAGSLPIP